MKENRKDVNILKTEEGSYIYSVFTSKIMHFKGDVEFRIQKDDNNGATVDIRSASRIGYSDLGANRARMEEIRKYLNSGAVESALEMRRVEMPKLGVCTQGNRNVIRFNQIGRNWNG